MAWGFLYLCKNATAAIGFHEIQYPMLNYKDYTTLFWIILSYLILICMSLLLLHFKRKLNEKMESKAQEEENKRQLDDNTDDEILNID